MKINEIVVISGKGGTGKTSLVASMIPYMKDSVVIADCDVDAPDLHILMNPILETGEDFFGMKKAKIDKNLCINCGKCYEVCAFGAIDKNININEMKCEGCTTCTLVCEEKAISMEMAKTGEIYESNCEYGPMFHARLIPGEEASGKLITLVRRKAKDFARKHSIENIVIDGSPGVACNVISSIMGVQKAVVVTEPTVSGLHDLKRVCELLKKYPIEILVVINKYTLSQEKTEEIEKFCQDSEINLALKIPFNKEMVRAISKLKIPSLEEKEFFEKIGFYNFMEKINKRQSL